MKTYCVVYEVTVSYDAEVRAKNRKEAIITVQNVIGEPLKVLDVWEVKSKGQK